MHAMTAMTRSTPATPSEGTPRNERERRAAEYLALRQLADEVKRLDRQLHREQSYAAARYAG